MSPVQWIVCMAVLTAVLYMVLETSYDRCRSKGIEQWTCVRTAIIGR